MPTRSPLLPLALALSAATVGCGQPSGARAPSDAGPPDAATTGTDPADAATAPPDSAPPDASLADASHWCATQLHQFCDDFDEGPLAQAWVGVDQQHGTIALDGTTYTSPAESLLARATPLTAGAVALARTGKRAAELSTAIHLAFDVRADALDSSGLPVVVASIQLSDKDGQSIESIDVTFRASGSTIDDYSPSPEGGPGTTTSYALSGLPTPLVGTWTRLKIDILLPAEGGVGDGSLTVYVGDNPQPVVDHARMAPTSQPAFPFVFVGIVSARGPSEALAVRIDDVTLDTFSN